MRKTSHIDDLVIGTLPERIVETIAKMEITVEDLQDVRSKKPGISVVVTKGVINVDFHSKIPIKKLIVVACSITVSILGVAVKIILDNWPTIRALSK